jgi:hypothetical protein
MGDDEEALLRLWHEKRGEVEPKAPSHARRRLRWTQRPRPPFAISLRPNSRPLARFEGATTWAHRVLAAKGTWLAADAKHIDEAFRQKLTEFQGASGMGTSRCPSLWERSSMVAEGWHRSDTRCPHALAQDASAPDERTGKKHRRPARHRHWQSRRQRCRDRSFVRCPRSD